MYAIIKAGGKQYKVAQNDVIAVNRLAASEGDEVVINEVLLVSNDKGVNIGAPYVAGAKVIGKVVRHYKGRKVRGWTYKPKKSESRRYGHRQYLTSVAISDIQA
ncbi:MAG: 50S ribosomal protein L21 [Armatimonadota bacterium]|nr:50S ribosomal protein L21 [bacterium]